MNDLFSDNADVVLKAAHRLSRMFFDEGSHPFVCRRAVEYGAPLSTIRAMRKWEANEKIQSACCALLALLQDNLNTNIRFGFRMEFVLAALSLGAMEVVVTAMRRFPNSRDIQSEGSGALTYLFAEETLVGLYRRRFVLELNGVALVLKAMEKFHNEPLIQKHGCEMFFYLSMELKTKRAIIKQGGSTAASKLLQRDFGQDTKKVHKWAEQLMKRLSAPEIC